MKLIPSQKTECQRIRRQLDIYISKELPLELGEDVNKHFETCKSCSQALKLRLSVKDRLKEAIQAERGPTHLRKRIQSAIRETESRKHKTTARTHWGLAMAAMLVLCLGGWSVLHLWKMRHSNGLPTQAGLPQAILEQTAALLKIGVADHIHCVIEHHDDLEWNTSEEMLAEMGPDYFGLVQLVNANVPQDFKVSVAHRCEVNGRRFVHLIFKNRENVLSLVITQKDNERFPGPGGRTSLVASGVPLHQARLQGFDVVGFETKGHFAYVVSALDQQENLQIASLLVSSVNDFLGRIES